MVTHLDGVPLLVASLARVRLFRAILLGMYQLSTASAHSGVVDRFAAAMTHQMTRFETILADGLLEEGWALFPKMHPPPTIAWARWDPLAPATLAT